MTYLLYVALLLGSVTPDAAARARQDARLQRRVAAVGLLAVARDPALNAHERSVLRLMAGAAGDTAALLVLGPEPRNGESSRFVIRPGTHFERRSLPDAAGD